VFVLERGIDLVQSDRAPRFDPELFAEFHDAPLCSSGFGQRLLRVLRSDGVPLTVGDHNVGRRLEKGFSAEQIGEFGPIKFLKDFIDDFTQHEPNTLIRQITVE
jgi:hypothetical protein